MKSAAMHVVRARFGNDVYYAAGGAAEFRVGAGRDNLKLFNGLESYVDGRPLAAQLLSEESVIVIASVQTDVVENPALTCECNLVAVRTLNDAYARRESQQILEFTS